MDSACSWETGGLLWFHCLVTRRKSSSSPIPRRVWARWSSQFIQTASPTSTLREDCRTVISGRRRSKAVRANRSRRVKPRRRVGLQTAGGCDFHTFRESGGTTYQLERPGLNIWRVSADGKREEPVTQLTGKRGVLGANIANDGKYVYFTWREDVSDIWMMDLQR